MTRDPNVARPVEVPADGATAASTRTRIAAHISTDGPVTAGQLARRLRLTPAAVRRHLDELLAAGDIQPWQQPDAGHRGRGRPARAYVLSAHGHATFTTSYDALAVAALRYLRHTAGDAAVADFADHYVQPLARRCSDAVQRAGEQRQDQVHALAKVLSTQGFQASVRSVEQAAVLTGMAGLQLCQGHCPVVEVAHEVPELCEAETRVLASVLEARVQRLATQAGGAHVCTTYIPLADHESERQSA